ncbi:MAG: MFS transporter [Betaproteobacteria bacterium]|nr:MAG: MFS transporter [Betaproteobacteria bacterium]
MQAKSAPGTAAVRMTPGERRATAGLAGIYGLRMLGMFIILPVFALYAETLPGGTDKTLVGIALGAYGLTQALLQVPFGWASDRYGRKRAIVSGLLLFALGSFVAAWAPDIVWTIVGRALQGAGAVSAAVLALTADLTRDSVRTTAMAVIGMTIGATFALSLIAGPVLKVWIGVPGIFAMTGVLALAAIAALRWAVPDVATPASAPADSGVSAFRRVAADGQLARLNYGIFALHALLMALFVQVPFELRDAGLAGEAHWKVYLPVIVGSAVLMWPALRYADRPVRSKAVFVVAVAVLALGQAVLAVAGARLWPLIAGLVVFFTAFNLLEAVLPSLVSKYAPRALKGTAVGVYSSVQFLGTFVGAAAGGWLAQHSGPAAVFGFGIVLTLLWLAASATMTPPPALRPGNYSMGET